MLTKRDGEAFVLNCELIQTIETIPETKVALENGDYFFVLESAKEIVEKVIAYKQRIFQNFSQQTPEGLVGGQAENCWNESRE